MSGTPRIEPIGVLPHGGQTVALTVAVDRLLDRFRDDPATRATYAETLTRICAVAGDGLPTAELTPEIFEQVMDRWAERAANT
jgi:integrase/recombinase XerC